MNIFIFIFSLTCYIRSDPWLWVTRNDAIMWAVLVELHIINQSLGDSCRKLVLLLTTCGSYLCLILYLCISVLEEKRSINGVGKSPFENKYIILLSSIWYRVCMLGILNFSCICWSASLLVQAVYGLTGKKFTKAILCFFFWVR